VAKPEGNPHEARHPFSLDRLQKIFAALPPRYGGRDARLWVPSLGLVTGCSLNELCGLDDVTTQDSVPVFVIRPDAEAGRKLKAAGTRRVVPLHPKLIRCDLLGARRE
jgi:integrase